MTTTTKDTERKTTWRDVAIRGSDGQMSAHSRRLEYLQNNLDLYEARERMRQAWNKYYEACDRYEAGEIEADELNDALEQTDVEAANHHRVWNAINSPSFAKAENEFELRQVYAAMEKHAAELHREYPQVSIEQLMACDNFQDQEDLCLKNL